MQNLASLQATPHQTVTLQTIDCQHINHTGDAKSCVSTGSRHRNDAQGTLTLTIYQVCTMCHSTLYNG